MPMPSMHALFATIISSSLAYILMAAEACFLHDQQAVGVGGRPTSEKEAEPLNLS